MHQRHSKHGSNRAPRSRVGLLLAGLVAPLLAFPLSLTLSGVLPTAPAAASASGGTVTTYTLSGTKYLVHTFNSSGTFTVPAGASIAVTFIEVGGGGGGGSIIGCTPGPCALQAAGGGGGGGAFSGTRVVTLGPGDYSVVVGSGGGAGANGTSSTFNGVTMIGGGAGSSVNSANDAPRDGGSGGGSRCGYAAGGLGAKGPPPAQANGQGAGACVGDGSTNAGAGGGGWNSYTATLVNANAAGGTGQTAAFSSLGSANGSTNINYGGGGGGGARKGTNANGAGGTGVGGAGATNLAPAGAGLANRGSGGGGASIAFPTGGSGSDGVVIIRYPVFALTYSANGYAGTPPPPVADLAASESTPVAHEGGLTASTGYKFAGWANTPTGPVAYPGGSTIGITANKTIYAKFAPISYQVAFDGNGADGGTVIGNQAFVYDTAQDLTRNQWTRTGYTFGGWTEDVNGTGRVYADQENVTNLSATDGDVVTLHAKWVPNDYTVAFDDNGSDGGTAIGPQAFVYDTAQDLTKNQWTRTGYTFGGWTRDVDGTVTTYADQENVKNLSDVDGDTVTLQAAWAPIGYQVAFGRNGADGGSMGNQLFVYDVAQPLTANALTRTGYDFTGWNTAADGSGTAYADQQDVNNLTDADGSVVTLYAQWSAHHYSVSFGGNGGARSMPGQAFTYGTPQALAANTYTRSGFSFVGWNTAANGSGTSYADQAVVNNLTPVDGATVTLYAQWETLPDTSGGSEKPPHLPSTGGPQLWLLVVALLLLGFGLVALVATRRRR